MVGVPGRSKGCHACRKRKIACSREIPACIICLNAGRPCPGYLRRTIFVQHNASLAIYSDSKHRRGLEFHCLPQSNLQNHVLSVSPQFLTARTPTVQSLEATAFQQGIFARVLSAYGCKSQYGPVNHGEWLAVVPELARIDPHLRNVATAFCLAQLGHQMNSQALMKSSLDSYIEGLSQIRKSLYDPACVNNDQLMASCLLCAMYEVLMGSDDWDRHCNGCGTLMEARGTSKAVWGLGHSMFVAFRLMGALQALTTRKTFLTRRDWTVLPFNTKPKTPLDRLTDLILDAPALLNAADRLNTITDTKLFLSTAADLLKSCSDLDVRLGYFLCDFELSLSPQKLYWCLQERPHTLSRMAFLLPKLAELDQFEFPDIRVAQIMLLYWAVTIMLHAGMHHLANAVAGVAKFHASESESTESLQPRHEFSDYVRNILRSVHYCLFTDAATLGASAIVAPIRIISDVLSGMPEHEEDARCAQMVLTLLRERTIPWASLS